MTSEQNVTKSRGLIIYRKTGDYVEYLLLQASQSRNHWMPPKGCMEEGETGMETAYWETWEECGLPKRCLEIIEDCQFELNYWHKDHTKQVIYWLAKLTKPDFEIKLSHEHKDFKWITLAQTRDYIDSNSRYASLINVFEKSEEYLNRKP